MTEAGQYRFMVHHDTGDVYAVEFRSADSDYAVGVCGPLHYTEVHSGNLEDFGYNNDDAEWFNQHKYQYRLLDPVEEESR